MTLITRGMGVILKGRSKHLKEAGKKFKKYLDKKKGKDLDWSDVKASAKIFTKSPHRGK
jgi:hypothetical protein